MVQSLIRFSIILQFFKRERETFPQEKKQLDDKLNDALKNCKRHGYVTNLMFQKIHENVGIIGKKHAAPTKNMRSFFAITLQLYICFSSIANDESNVIEPILPTNYHIAYQSIEANRQEVNKENIFNVQINYYLIQVMNDSLYKQTIAIYDNTGFAQLA